MSSNIEEQDNLQYESETSHHYVNVTFHHQDKEQEVLVILLVPSIGKSSKTFGNVMPNSKPCITNIV